MPFYVHLRSLNILGNGVCLVLKEVKDSECLTEGER